MTLVVKVYDHECEVCLQMKRHDRPTFESLPDTVFTEVALDDIVSPEATPQMRLVAQLVEQHCLNDDYTLDLPAYLILDKSGKMLGSHVGAATIRELRAFFENSVQTVHSSE
jgi:hypothetical protein